MVIEKIQVRNFRSIENATVNLSRLNVFVGRNDSGKSNFLRAIDLFFNFGKTYSLVWSRDFCSFSKPTSGRSPEITITLHIRPSGGFRNKRLIKWSRSWREYDGLFRNDISYADNSKIDGKSKIGALLRNVRLDYVPAIKGSDYFSRLLASIHDMLERTAESEIRSAATNFTESINAHTTAIVADIFGKLGLKSDIQLPRDLGDLFSKLEFSSDSNGQTYSLDQRGDGIKARHIPIILRWLASQAETLSAKGRPKVVSIWAYEEPENNLELGYCLDLARELLDQSRRTQTFISTHSPAFYSLGVSSALDQVAIFGVEKCANGEKTAFKEVKPQEVSLLDDSMGLMPLVQPYIAAALEKIERLKHFEEELRNQNLPIVFVEGPSDNALLVEAFRLFHPELEGKFSIKCSTESSGGHNWVADQLIAWGHAKPACAGVGLFDKDPEACRSRKDATEILKRKKTHKCRCLHIIPNANMRALASAGLIVPYSIDELLRKRDWDYAEKRGWLVERNDLIKVYGFDQRDVTFNQYLEQTVPKEKLRRFVTHKISTWKKENFSKYIINQTDDEKRLSLESLKPTMNELVAKLEIA